MTEAYVPSMVQEEPEMNKVKEIFDRALNALVDATSLAKTVEQLKTDLESLKVQVTHYRNTIANQDDQITRLRQDRDAARTAQYQAEDNARHMTTDLDNTKRDLDHMSQANVRLNDRVTSLTKEKDDAEFKLLELQEAHNALSKKMDDIKSHMQSLFGMAEKVTQADNTLPPVVPPVTMPPEPSTVSEAPPAYGPEVLEPEPPQQQQESYWPQSIVR